MLPLVEDGPNRLDDLVRSVTDYPQTRWQDLLIDLLLAEKQCSGRARNVGWHPEPAVGAFLGQLIRDTRPQGKFAR